MTDGPNDRAASMGDVDRWVELVCPVCEHDCWDGQGYEKTSDGYAYRHRCPDCGAVVLTPVTVDGEVLGTR